MLKNSKMEKLDRFKKENEDEYTHLLQSVWKGSTYGSKLRELTQEEMEMYNERAKFIEEGEDID
jgi:hypothetical protein